MSNTDTNLQAILTKAANLADAAAPRLEKLANMESQFDSTVREVAEKLASCGQIPQGDIEAVCRDIKSGGISKFAEVVDFVIRNSAAPALGGPSTEKSAEVELTADQRFERILGLS